MILLSPEQICEELNRSHKVGATFYIPERLPKDGHYAAIAKAQAEEIHKWGEDACTEHPMTGYAGGQPCVPVRWINTGIYYLHRKDCPDCWQQLKKEIGG